MTARQRHRPAADDTRKLANSVNKFTSSPLQFAGAGRRRTEAEEQEARERRERDQALAARLERLGLNPYASEQTFAAVDLATKGQRAVDYGRPRRRLCVFSTEARREQREAAVQMKAWLASLTPAERPQRVVQIRLRPRTGPTLVGCLREHHREQTEALGERLRYVRRQFRCEPLAYGTHHRPLEGGALIDLHFHVAVAVDPKDDGPLLSYLRRRYDLHITDDDASDPVPFHRSPESLAVYLRSGTERYVDDFEDHNLKEYLNQVYNPKALHRYQALGRLRDFAGHLNAKRLRPVEDAGGGLVLAPKSVRRPRLAASARFRSGPSVLALSLAWVDGELRPVALVRGWRGRWADLAERYDLGLAVTAARLAMASSFTTAIPESSSVAPLPRPPNHTPPGDTDCPW